MVQLQAVQSASVVIRWSRSGSHCKKHAHHASVPARRTPDASSSKWKCMYRNVRRCNNVCPPKSFFLFWGTHPNPFLNWRGGDQDPPTPSKEVQTSQGSSGKPPWWGYCFLSRHSAPPLCVTLDNNCQKKVFKMIFFWPTMERSTTSRPRQPRASRLALHIGPKINHFGEASNQGYPPPLIPSLTGWGGGHLPGSPYACFWDEGLCHGPFLGQYVRPRPGGLHPRLVKQAPVCLFCWSLITFRFWHSQIKDLFR